MNPTPFVAAWAFVVLVTGYDCRFALRHSELFELWELNPLARTLGVGPAVCVRAGTVLVALGLVLGATPRARAAGTLVVLAVHVWLAGVYVLVER